MDVAPKPIRILIVDDDVMSRELLTLLLDAEGYEVESAESGAAALALLPAGGPAPDVILTDVQMPGISGRALAEALRAACGHNSLLLAMSGSGPPDEAIRAFDGFLMKPFTMEELRAAIGRMRDLHAIQSTDLAYKASQDVNEINSSGVLDEAIYGQLSNSMKRPQLHQLYTMCLNDARQRVTVMRELAAQGEGAALVREAHAIKGSGGMLGALEIYGLAGELEARGLTTSGLDGMKGVNPLDELMLACERLERILKARDVASKI